MAALVLAALAALAALAGCSPAATERTTRGGTLDIVLAPGALAHIDPQRVADTDTSALLGAFVLRTLTVRTADGTAVVPDLASGPPDVSSDRTSWTFPLRPDITFDNALPLTCADVKHGIARNFARELGNDGTGAVAVLDVPTDAAGGSAYRGPYVPAVDVGDDGQPGDGPASDVAAFDHAVECSPDGTTITFRLREPVGRFDEVLAEPAFAPVPVASDIGPGYEQRPVGTGPYRVEERTDGAMTLVRSLSWDERGDADRPAYPDVIRVVETDDPDAVARSIVDGGEAVRTTVGPAISEPLLTAWVDDGVVEPPSDATIPVGGAGAVLVGGPDLWVRHLAIDLWRVPDLAVRRAIQAAIDREQVRDALVSPLGGDLTDSLVAPGLTLDHDATGLWTSFDEPVDASGSLDVARALLAHADLTAVGPLRLDHPDTAADAAAAAVVIADLRAIGLDVTARPVPVETYAEHIASPDLVGELTMVDHAPAPAAGIAVVADLLTIGSPLNLSHWGDDTTGRAIVIAESVADRAQQGQQVAALDARAVLDGAAVPLLSYRVQRVAGPGVGGAALSSTTGAWAYGELSVR